MKALTIVVMLSALVALANASCLAASYCATCSNSTCSACPLGTSFKQGAMALSSGKCVARTTAQKVPVGAANVDAYTSSTATTLDVVCKSGYYAWNDSVDTTKKGCYATSTLTSAPLNQITAQTVTTGLVASPTGITNCAYIIGTYSANAKGWSCGRCKSGYTLATATSCTSSVSITNCDIASTISSTTYCTACKSGYVVNSGATACVAETTTTKNCAVLATGNTACGTCDKSSYFSGTACVKAAFLKAFSVLLLGMMLYFN